MVKSRKSSIESAMGDQKSLVTTLDLRGPFGLQRNLHVAPMKPFQMAVQNHWCYIRPAMIAVIPTATAVAMKWYQIHFPDEIPEGVFPENESAYSTLSWLLGMVLVFRTSQSYARFWDGAVNLHLMQTELFDACAQTCAFAESSKASRCKIDAFRLTIVRLFSLFHGVALQQITKIEDEDIKVIDHAGLDPAQLRFMRGYSREVRPDIVAQWVCRTITEAVSTGVVSTPPPIVSRVFQEINSGLIALAQMRAISELPFPKPYAMMVKMLLVCHLFMTPFYAVGFTNARFWAGMFSFVPVFSLWCIQHIAVELEQPFADGIDDLDLATAQNDMNECLLPLLNNQTQWTPDLDEVAKSNVCVQMGKNNAMAVCHLESRRLSHDSKLQLGDNNHGMQQYQMDSAESRDRLIVPRGKKLSTLIDPSGLPFVADPPTNNETCGVDQLSLGIAEQEPKSTSNPAACDPAVSPCDAAGGSSPVASCSASGAKDKHASPERAAPAKPPAQAHITTDMDDLTHGAPAQPSASAHVTTDVHTLTHGAPPKPSAPAHVTTDVQALTHGAPAMPSASAQEAPALMHAAPAKPSESRHLAETPYPAPAREVLTDEGLQIYEDRDLSFSSPLDHGIPHNLLPIGMGEVSQSRQQSSSRDDLRMLAPGGHGQYNIVMDGKGRAPTRSAPQPDQCGQQHYSIVMDEQGREVVSAIPTFGVPQFDHGQVVLVAKAALHRPEAHHVSASQQLVRRMLVPGRRHAPLIDDESSRALPEGVLPVMTRCADGSPRFMRVLFDESGRVLPSPVLVRNPHLDSSSTDRYGSLNQENPPPHVK